MRRTDILILIAIWEFSSALIAFIAIASLGALAFPPVAQLAGAAAAGGLFGLSVLTAVLAVYFLVSMAAGIGVVLGRGWGRTWAIAHAAVTMAAVPFGTVIGALTIIYVTRPRIKPYFQGRRSAASAA